MVVDEDLTPLGVLTPLDLACHSYNLVIDCLTYKPALEAHSLMDDALRIMMQAQSEALAVYDEAGKLDGLVFKNDLLRQHGLLLELQNRLLSEISWSQSHETRQPVATILGLLNILDRDSLTEENKQIVLLLENTTQSLDHIIRKMVEKASSV